MTRLSSSYFPWSDFETISTAYIAAPLVRICKKLKPQNILDIGCGNGSCTRVLTDELDCDVLGIDPEEAGIALARTRAPKARFEVFDVYDDPAKLGPEQFDVVVSTEVIEHLYYPRQLLKFARAKLKPGGTLILSTPYHGYLKNLVLAVTNRWDVHLDSNADGGHIKFWSPASLSALLESEGFAVTEFHGVGRCYGLWKSMIIACQPIDE